MPNPKGLETELMRSIFFSLFLAACGGSEFTSGELDQPFSSDAGGAAGERSEAGAGISGMPDAGTGATAGSGASGGFNSAAGSAGAAGELGMAGAGGTDALPEGGAAGDGGSGGEPTHIPTECTWFCNGEKGLLSKCGGSIPWNTEMKCQIACSEFSAEQIECYQYILDLIIDATTAENLCRGAAGDPGNPYCPPRPD